MRRSASIALVGGLALSLTLGAALVWNLSWGSPPTVSPGWLHLSSARGELPVPGQSDQQTAALVLDIDRDGIDDFVIGARSAAPALVWYRRIGAGWQRYVIEPGLLPLEAGGAVHDIDGDGDLDIVMGEDASGNHVYWWANPHPHHDPGAPWQRRVIKDGGGNQHHDQIFADLDGDGQAELAFWNQRAQQLLLAEIPPQPTTDEPWPLTVVFAAETRQFEGLAAADIDGDGRQDLVGGGRWFQHRGGTEYVARLIDDDMRFARVAAGQLKQGGRPEVVFVVGDDIGRLEWYEWDGTSWLGHDLLGIDVIHGHSLELGDIDRDGNLDIFCAEMHTPGHGDDATAWIFYGDGQGHFRQEVVSTGLGNHESRLADLDGDGDLDILTKPYSWRAPRVDVLLNRQAPLERWVRHVVDPAKPWQSMFVAAADLDGDGRQDIVTGGWWYPNPGEAGGPWQRRTIGEPLHNMAAVYDFDGDGDADILGTRGEGSEPNAQLVWARNRGNGTFEVMGALAEGDGDFLQGVAIGRFDGLRPEIALSWHAAGRGVQMLTVPADPAAARWPLRKISEGSQDEALSVGDIDRDGAPDLLLGTRWLRHRGSAWELREIGPEPLPDRNRLADLNGDGRLDAIVGFEAISQPGDVVWYEQPQLRDGPWAKHVVATVIGPMSLDVGDLDQDGDLDLVVGEHDLAHPESAKLYVFENADGRGGRWLAHIVAVGDEHHDGALLTDIDGDGDLDIVSIGWSHGRVLLYENRANAEPGSD